MIYAPIDYYSILTRPITFPTINQEYSSSNYNVFNSKYLFIQSFDQYTVNRLTNSISFTIINNHSIIFVPRINHNCVIMNARIYKQLSIFTHCSRQYIQRQSPQLNHPTVFNLVTLAQANTFVPATR